jgi:hypothetical protein
VLVDRELPRGDPRAAALLVAIFVFGERDLLPAQLSDG